MELLNDAQWLNEMSRGACYWWHIICAVKNGAKTVVEVTCNLDNPKPRWRDMILDACIRYMAKNDKGVAIGEGDILTLTTRCLDWFQFKHLGQIRYRVDGDVVTVLDIEWPERCHDMALRVERLINEVNDNKAINFAYNNGEWPAGSRLPDDEPDEEDVDLSTLSGDDYLRERRRQGWESQQLVPEPASNSWDYEDDDEGP